MRFWRPTCFASALRFHRRFSAISCATRPSVRACAAGRSRKTGEPSDCHCINIHTLSKQNNCKMASDGLQGAVRRGEGRIASHKSKIQSAKSEESRRLIERHELLTKTVRTPSKRGTPKKECQNPAKTTDQNIKSQKIQRRRFQNRNSLRFLV